MSDYVHFGPDFNCYWCAARIAMRGGDPYAPDAMATCFKIEGLDQAAYQFNYPPISFPVMYPFALIDRPTAKLLWLIILSISILFSYWLVLRRLKNSAGTERTKWTYVFTPVILFPYFLSELFWGQMHWIPFLGLSACLYLYDRKRFFWAGLALSFLLVKVHLFTVLFGFLASSIKRGERVPFGGGLIAGGSILSGIVILVSPHIIPLFISHLGEFGGNAEIYWWGVSIGQRLSTYGIYNNAGFVIAALGFPIGFLLGRYRRAENAAMFIPLSILFAPHAFSTAGLLAFEPWVRLFGRAFSSRPFLTACFLAAVSTQCLTTAIEAGDVTCLLLVLASVAAVMTPRELSSKT